MLSCAATLGSVHCSESVLFSIKTGKTKHKMCMSTSQCVVSAGGMFESLEMTRVMQPKPWAGNAAQRPSGLGDSLMLWFGDPEGTWHSLS